MDYTGIDCYGCICVVVSFSQRGKGERVIPNLTFLVPRTTLVIALLPRVVRHVGQPPGDAEIQQYYFRLASPPPTTGGKEEELQSRQQRYINWFYPVGVVKDYAAELNKIHFARAQPTPNNTSPQVDYSYAAPLLLHFHYSTEVELTCAPFATPFDVTLMEGFVSSELRNYFKYTYSILYSQYKTVFYDMVESTLKGAYDFALSIPTHSVSSQEFPIRANYAWFLSEVQQRKRSQIATVVRIGFPFVFQSRNCMDANNAHYFLHRIQVGKSEEPLTFGAIVWRAFLTRSLEFKAHGYKSRHSTEIEEKRFALIYRAFEKYFEGFLAIDSVNPPPLSWGALHSVDEKLSAKWEDFARAESSGIAKLTADYECPTDDAPNYRIRGIDFPAEDNGDDDGSRASMGAAQKLFFEVEGVRPSLFTPADFMEGNLCSSDRVLYITVVVE